MIIKIIKIIKEHLARRASGPYGPLRALRRYAPVAMARRAPSGKAYQIALLVVVVGISLTLATPVFALEVIYPPVFGAETPQVFMEEIANCEEECEAHATSRECLTCQRDGYAPGNAFPLYLKYFYYLLIHLTGLAALYAVLSGAFLFFFSGGVPGRAKEGLNKIRMGAVGVAIILFSVLMLNILDPSLLVFKINRPDVPEAIILDVPEVVKEFPTYVEIPYGGLVNIVRWKSKIVLRRGEAVMITADMVSGAAQCLDALTAECDCDAPPVDTCCGTYNLVTGDCDRQLPVDDTCPTGECDPNADPCDIPTPTTITGCLSGLPDNLRAAIEEQSASLASLTSRLAAQRESLLAAKEDLKVSNHNLKLAEALMRDSYYPPLNLDTFLEGIEEKEVKRIWEYEEEPKEGGISGNVIDYGKPGLECQGHCIGEDIPRCIECVGTFLVCFGNNYRCCATDPYVEAMCSGNNDCSDPPRAAVQVIEGTCDCGNFKGCRSPRTCNDGWKSAEDVINGVGKNTILFNGMSYTIPAGGVKFVGSTVFQSCKLK